MLCAMPAPGRPEGKLDVTWSLRISATARKEAEHAGKRLRTNDQDAYRFAADIGLRLLREIDYAIEEAIVDRALEIAVTRRKEKR